MPRPDVCLCLDWEIADHGDRLVLTPSRQTIGKTLAASAVLLVIALGLAAWFGVPPGRWEPGRAQREAAELEKQAQRAEAKAAHVHASRSGSAISQAVAKDFAEQASAARRRAEAAKAAAANAKATLGPTKDKIVWGAMGGLVALAAALPLLAARERITIVHDGNALWVRRRGQLVRSRSHDIRAFEAIGVIAERVILSGKYRNDDLGWQWTVRLLPHPEDAEMRELVIACERLPTLPPRIERLTARVRPVVEFLQRETGLPVLPPVTADVSNVEYGEYSTTARIRAKRHGPVEARRYKPLP